MKYKLSKEESLILRLFVEREVPDFICEVVIDNINLSEHYEELFNYSIAVLDGTDVAVGAMEMMGRAFLKLFRK